MGVSLGEMRIPRSTQPHCHDAVPRPSFPVSLNAGTLMSEDMLGDVLAAIKDAATKSSADEPFVTACCSRLEGFMEDEESFMEDEEKFASYPTHHEKGARPPPPTNRCTDHREQNKYRKHKVDLFTKWICCPKFDSMFCATMGKVGTATKRKGKSLGVRQTMPKPASKPASAPSWYTVAPAVVDPLASPPATAADGFKVSPGVDVGKAAAVRQTTSATTVVTEAAQALADIVATAPMHPDAANGVRQVATALGMATVPLEKSAGDGTKRSKDMVGTCARRKAVLADPFGAQATAKRTPLT